MFSFRDFLLEGRKGTEKFDKYFAGKGEVETFAKGPSGADVSVFDSAKSARKSKSLKDGTPITVIVPDKYSVGDRYFVKFDGGEGWVADAGVGKPKDTAKIGNSELERVTASNFIGKGLSIKYNYAGVEIACKEFFSAKQLSMSIIEGLSKTRGISDPAKKTFEHWIKGDISKPFEWDEKVLPAEKNKLGIYLGELLVGMYALAGKTEGHFSKDVFTEKVSKFLVPTDPAFSGVDSFIELESGEIIPISSKFGKGAAASFFSNILHKGYDHYDHLPDGSVFKLIVGSMRTLGLGPKDLRTKAKHILYEFGIRRLLNLNSDKVSNTFAVFQNIKKGGELSSESELVLEKIKSYSGTDSEVLKNLPKSITAFFSRETAKALRRDPESMSSMIEVLSGKKFWQANLDMKKWLNGTVYFKMVSSGTAKLSIIGDKAAIGDIDGSQGMINYVLKIGE